MNYIKPLRETAPDARLKSRMDERALLGQRANRWPFERAPESHLFANAIACLEVVLKYSEEARRVYAKLVDAWELPGCQVLIEDFKRYRGDNYTWAMNLLRELTSNLDNPEWRSAWTMNAEKSLSNEDWQTLLSYCAEVIRVGFNRNKAQPKVIADRAPYLITVIGFRSLVDYYELEIASLTKYRGGVDHLMTGNPTPRAEREQKQALVNTLKREGFTLCHDYKLLGDAEKWYGSRKDPGNIEIYIDQLAKECKYIDRARIEKDIIGCDLATGYPRKWQKHK